MRSYRKHTEVVDKLRALIDSQLRSGNYILPGEPKLAVEMGASRTTLRKAIAVLEQEGLLKNEARGKTITRKHARKRKGLVVFLTGGKGWIILNAWNRLWTMLSSKANEKGWDCKLELFMSDSKFDASVLETADFIVYAGGSKGVWGDEFKHFAKGRSNIIGVEEPEFDFLRHVVCLDNKEVGRMAAKLLVESGYRKPAFLRQDNGYFGFVKREEGFLEELSKSLPGYQPPVFHMRGQRISEYLKDYMEKVEQLCGMDIDSLFVASDGLIDIAYDSFALKREIPADFGLVTLSGSHESLVHQPPITAISHGTTKVAQAILELIEKLNNGEHPNAPSLSLVKPSVHPGATTKERKVMLK